MIQDKFYIFFKNELSKEYISNYRESIAQYLSSENFKSKLSKTIKDRNFSVFSLLDLYIDLFHKYDFISDKEWLKKIYNFVVNKSFPHKFIDDFDLSKSGLYLFFINTLSFFISLKDNQEQNDFQSKYGITLLTVEEEKNLTRPQEYFIFKKSFYNLHINELLHLDMAITGHNTLDHIIGVNYLSMYIARQLYSLGLPVDLGLVVGTSLGHDIGKYGVEDKEINRVPYLHYYYTEQWFKNLNMNRIGHIATNHSTWDLELETLPIESLILIYSDFRVKNKIEANIYNMHIFPLSESFDVILEKLDNVDEEKENRYKKVYKKLKDFEDFIISLGVDTDLINNITPPFRKPFELMDNQEVIDNIKYLAIDHNINLMAKLTDDNSFNEILELARGESDWRKLRLYLQTFMEYSTYLTQNQKITTLHFLSDQLLHKAEDIRVESANLIGRLVALFDEEYRKELPQSVMFNKPHVSSENILDRFLQGLLFPDHKIADSQVEWLYNLKTIINSLFKYSQKSHHNRYFDVLCIYYSKYKSLSNIGQFYLSQTINYIPLDSLDDKRLLMLYEYTLKQLDSDDIQIRLSTLDIIHEMLNNKNNVIFIASIRNWIKANLVKSPIHGENYLKHIIGLKINISPKDQIILDKNYELNKSNASNIFLQNLKTATEWIRKKINIDILYDQVLRSPSTKGLHTAMHLCNILKVSAVERVRNYAGITLLNIFPLLSLEERNDVAVELIRALEMESYHFSKFIPDYLGQLVLYLPPRELDEIIDEFENKIKVSSSGVIFLLLNTIVVSIENYKSYIEQFPEVPLVHDERINRLLGLLTISMTSYDHSIKSESLRVIGSTLFNSTKLTLFDKYNLFTKISKKILSLLAGEKEDNLLFYNNAASLNYIYRFISDYEFYHGQLYSEQNQNIAFFPGSFDPFSLSHKEIAIEIRNLGFEVYLSVDEFSWSKRTEPHNFRRDIINMSIANEKDINLFPRNMPINISNPRDLNKLKELFKGKNVFIVVGSDVLINASAYKYDSHILNFSHIIFDRKSSISMEDDEKKLNLSLKNIRGNIIKLKLPPQYEDISSSQIRENIDLNRDISKFIDPLAQSYIYKYGLYLRQPQYKTLFETKTIELEVFSSLHYDTLNEIKQIFGEWINIEPLELLKRKLNYKILLVKDALSKKLLGFSSFHYVNQSMLYDEFNNTEITEYIRKNVKGKVLLISGISVLDNSEELIEIVLNETLSLAINKDYNYALYNDSLSKMENIKIEEQLLLQGFLKTKFLFNDNSLFMVDMNNPSTLNLDLENMLKPPYNNHPKIQSTIRDTRNRLKKVISKLYPGELLLSYNKNMIYSKLIQKICDLNQVNVIQTDRKIIGENMCVPFGSILNGSIIPNTVTKTMHTEKIFRSDITNFTIGSYPNYLSLEDQANMLKSFNRPVILVDDLLHKGYRINVVEPILKNSGVEIKKIIVGILSGRGKEIGSIKNIPVDSAYFVPNLKLWFNESSQYPFIGGDMVESNKLKSFSIPSVNMILPYVSPKFIKNTSNDALYDLSEVCLENSFLILEAIEEVYQSINQKNLTIKSLGEVIVSPRHPDIDKSIDLNLNSKPSNYLIKDLEYLRRLENIIRRQ